MDLANQVKESTIFVSTCKSNQEIYYLCFCLYFSFTHFQFEVASLLKKKQNEDQGFEIIKEVPGSIGGGAPRMGNPFGGGGANMFSNPNLSNLAALMAGGNLSNINNMTSLLAGMGASGAGGNMGGLINQSSMLQKCKFF